MKITFFIILLIGIALGLILSMLQAEKWFWEFERAEIFGLIFYSLIGVILGIFIDMRFTLADNVTNKWKNEIGDFLLGPDGTPIWKCNAELSREVIDSFLRRNWKVTIEDLWGDENKDIINKLTLTNLDALRLKENGFFDARVSSFLKDGIVGFTFMNPDCKIVNYAFWARQFESSAKTSLCATNILLPSELFSDENIKETIKHSISFNLNDQIIKKRIQIYTEEKVTNNLFRNKTTFDAEINTSVLNQTELDKLVTELYNLEDDLYSEVIDKLNNELNKKITCGDLYKALFKRDNNLQWKEYKKTELGKCFFGDYVIVDESIVLRYDKDTETLELICGEIVKYFLEPFDHYFTYI